MELSDNDITITIPKAQILTITVKPESYTDDSYVISPDGINKIQFYRKNKQLQ